MTYLSQSPTHGSRNFVPACIALCLSSLFSILTINFPNNQISLTFLPLLVVCLWPRGVNSVVSILTIFLVGLWMDWITNGALGQWAMVYLTVYAVLRPDRREGAARFFVALRLWLVGMAAGALMLIFTGWVAYGTWPNFTNLFQQALLASAFMPLAVFARNLTRYLVSDPDDRDYG